MCFLKMMYRNMEEKSLMECAVYSGKKGGQLVVQWVKHCKDSSIDVIQEFCHVNSDGVRKKLTPNIRMYFRILVCIDWEVVSLGHYH